MALNGLLCADVPLRKYSLTHSQKQALQPLRNTRVTTKSR